MSGKPKSIPSVSRARKNVSTSEQIPVPYDQNRGRQSAEHTSQAADTDAPTDENFVNDDIIEENSHVISPVSRQKPTSKTGGKGQPAA